MSEAPFVVDTQNYMNVSQKRTRVIAATVIVGLLASGALLLLSIVSVVISLLAHISDGFVLAFIWMAAAIAILAASLSRRQLLRLLESGQQITGKLTFSEGYYLKEKSQMLSFSKGNWWIKITYEFVTPTGATIAHTVKILRNDIKGQTPKVGIPVQILYLDDRHFRVV